MELEEFIEQNQDELTAIIKANVPNIGPEYFDSEGKVDPEECRQWLLNDEGLYNWAVRSGVAI